MTPPPTASGFIADTPFAIYLCPIVLPLRILATVPIPEVRIVLLRESGSVLVLRLQKSVLCVIPHHDPPSIGGEQHGHSPDRLTSAGTRLEPIDPVKPQSDAELPRKWCLTDRSSIRLAEPN